MRIVGENCTDVEAMIDLLQRASERMDRPNEPEEDSQNFTDALVTLLSRTRATKRWALNYADRCKILIDLVSPVRP